MCSSVSPRFLSEPTFGTESKHRFFWTNEFWFVSARYISNTLYEAEGDLADFFKRGHIRKNGKDV